MPTYMINEQLINYEEQGPENGPVAILIHGWSSSTFTWAPVLPSLSKRYRCIAVDLPGFGQSPAPKEPPTIAGYADLLGSLIEWITDRPVLLLGHSMGGQISATLACATRCWSAHGAAQPRVQRPAVDTREPAASAACLGRALSLPGMADLHPGPDAARLYRQAAQADQLIDQYPEFAGAASPGKAWASHSIGWAYEEAGTVLATIGDADRTGDRPASLTCWPIACCARRRAMPRMLSPRPLFRQVTQAIVCWRCSSPLSRKARRSRTGDVEVGHSSTAGGRDHGEPPERHKSLTAARQTYEKLFSSSPTIRSSGGRLRAGQCMMLAQTGNGANGELRSSRRSVRSRRWLRWPCSAAPAPQPQASRPKPPTCWPNAAAARSRAAQGSGASRVGRRRAVPAWVGDEGIG